jgi:peptide/nickel transport system ATP-binding protein
MRQRGRRAIVSNLDLELSLGETIAIVGESGSGKSMTARALVGLLPQGMVASGDASYRGRNLLALSEREMAKLRGHEIGLVMQDPFTMLNPVLQCGAHIVEGLRLESGRRWARRGLRSEALARLAEVGIEDPAVADAFPFQLSGGMRQRVGLGAALARDPNVLVADEPTTALDVTTQKEILGLLKSLQERRGMGVVLITHDLRVAFSVCDRVYVLYAGALLETGTASDLEDEPLHPYTLGLLLAEPPADRRLAELSSIGGSVPRASDVEEQCPFASRCQWVAPACVERKPPLVEVAPGRFSACARISEIRAELSASRMLARAGAEVSAPARTRAVVHVANVSKHFETTRRHRRKVAALDGVSLEIGANEAVGLVGESGSGKTTLARCMLGLEKPNAGSIVVDDVHAEDYGKLSMAERRRLRRSIQIIFQDPYSTLNPSHTVGWTLRDAVMATGGGARTARVEVSALLERVGLPADYAQRKPVALSGGERQRVAIARALAARPKIIVCDEPTSALDVSVQAQILNLLQSIRDELGTSFLLITHDLAIVRQFVERVYVLYRGQVVESGPVADVLDNPRHDYTAKLIESIPTAQAAWLENRPEGVVPFN